MFYQKMKPEESQSFKVLLSIEKFLKSKKIWK